MKRFLTICIGLGIVVLLFGALGWAGLSKPELGRGQRCVRSHPYTTMALTLVPRTFDANEYHDVVEQNFRN